MTIWEKKNAQCVSRLLEKTTKQYPAIPVTDGPTENAQPLLPKINTKNCQKSISTGFATTVGKQKFPCPNFLNH